MNATIRNTFAVAAALATPLCLRAQSADTALKPVTLSGYVTSSITSSNNGAGGAIVGRMNGRRQNEFMLNVADFTVERVAPTDRASAGFRVEALFGQNAAVMKSIGLDLGPNADIWQAYVTLNLPLSGASRYVQFKAGKMATLMGVEVVEDVLNPNLDVGSQDIFLEPFTETGMEFDAKLSAKFDFELRISNGWDQVTDLNTGKTFMARLGVTPTDRTLIALVGYTGAEQPDSTGPKRSGANLVITQKIGGSTSLAAQADFGREAGLGANGGDAEWSAGGVWLTQDLTPHASLGLRADYMKDRDGVRTSGVLGYPVNTGQTVSSVAATLTLKNWDHALVRPELRYDHSTLAVFSGQQQQVSLALGLSYMF